jgi:hypothetical protein
MERGQGIKADRICSKQRLEMSDLALSSNRLQFSWERGGTVVNPRNGAAAHTRPEIELLLCCARTRVNAETATRIRDLVQEQIDWTYLIETAISHGVMPLLYRNLSSLCPAAMPKPVGGEARDWFHAHVQRNLFLTAELLRLLRVFADHGIPALPYKGPVLARAVYGDISLRSFTDLDILVDKRDIPRAKDLILSEGYRFGVPLTDKQQAARLRSKNCKDFTFTDVQDFAKLELHWEFASPSLFPLDTKSLWDRPSKLNVGGLWVLNLRAEDMLLMLCVHGAKHFFRRLEWICDISELLAASSEISWDEVVGRATTLRSKRMLFFGLIMAWDILGTELPQQVRSSIQADAGARGLAARAKRLLFSKTDSTSQMFRRHSHRIGLRESRADRMRLRSSYLVDYLRALVMPNEEDRKRVPLTGLLSVFYVLLRPVRLLRCYGISLFSRRRRLGRS